MVHGLFLEDIRSFSGALIGLHNVLSSLGFYLSEAVGLAMYFDLGPQVIFGVLSDEVNGAIMALRAWRSFAYQESRQELEAKLEELRSCSYFTKMSPS